MIWMKHKILEDFFYGNIHPNEESFQRSAEYGKAAECLVNEEAQLRAMLSQQGMDSLERLISAQITVTALTSEGYYIDGLKTGFRLALALLDDETGFSVP